MTNASCAMPVIFCGWLLARLIGVGTAQAAHGNSNFASGNAAATVHAVNTSIGAALLGTNATGFLGGVGVRGERSGGTGDGVQGIRSGTGSRGHGVVAERTGSGFGYALVGVNETTADTSWGSFIRA